VQGVLFRDFTRRLGRKLGLVGTVENLPDGTVKVVAEGEEAMLNKIVERLHNGPPLAKVTDIKIEWQEASGAFPNFKIIYRGFFDRF
jgi:acylphosphatase